MRWGNRRVASGLGRLVAAAFRLRFALRRAFGRSVLVAFLRALVGRIARRLRRTVRRAARGASAARLGIALFGLARLSARRRVAARIAAARDVLLVAGFEVGLVPTAALQSERNRGNLLPEKIFSTRRTLHERWFAHSLQRFEFVFATFALILVDRHVQKTLR